MKVTLLGFLGAVTLTGVTQMLAPAALAAPPAVGTGTAVAITATTATLVGAADPDGQETTYAFQYGTTTAYASQTAARILAPPITYKTITAVVTGLRAGTTYHFRLIAANESGITPGRDVIFTTAGRAQPAGAPPVAVTGQATAIGDHSAVLTGTLNPSSTNIHYYFELGTREPYELQTISQSLPAGRGLTVQAPVSGLQSNRIFYYRLIAVGENGQVSAGSVRSFVTVPAGRLRPKAVTVHISPTAQRRLPAVVTVSGRLVPPPSLPRAAACRGFVDIAFRQHNVAIQLLRAGIHASCTFSLRARFLANRLPHRGRINVTVLFPGNEVMSRLAAPTRTIQVG